MHRRRVTDDRKRLVEASDRCVYVGQTGVDPHVRFIQHKEAYKSSKYVRLYGLRLLPNLATGWGPYKTWEESRKAELELFKHLRDKGYVTFGGH